MKKTIRLLLFLLLLGAIGQVPLGAQPSPSAAPLSSSAAAPASPAAPPSSSAVAPSSSVAPPAVAVAPSASSKVQVALSCSPERLVPGSSCELRLDFTIPSGAHIYAPNPGQTGLPTKAGWKLPLGLSVATEAWSAPEKSEDGGFACNVYQGSAFVVATVDVAPSVAPGQTLTLSAQPSWLLCDTSCRPGKDTVSIDLPVVAAADAAHAADAVRAADATNPADATRTADATRAADSTNHAADSTNHAADSTNHAATRTAEATNPADATRTADATRAIPVADEASSDVPSDSARPNPVDKAPAVTAVLSALCGAFLGGLLLNFMPCVFPVLSLKALELVRSSQQDKRQQRRQALYYALGVVMSFWLVAAGLSVLRAVGYRLGWGFQMQSPYFVATVAFLFVALALNMFGLFEIGLGLTRLGQEQSGGRSSWLSGALAVVVATPCTAPFMGTALGVAFTLPLLYGWLIFTALGLGMASPLVGLAWFPVWQRALPKPGAWMIILRQALAFPLLLTAVYFAWIADVQTGPYVAGMMVSGWVLLGAAAWIYGHWQRHHRWYLLVMALVLALAGWAMPCAKYLHQQVNTIDTGSQASSADSQANLGAAPWSPQAVQDALADGHPVFVDFGASWCLTCQVNENLVLKNAAVQRAFQEHKVVFLKADWTNRDEHITQALEEYGRTGVPLYVYYEGHINAKPQLLPEVLSPEIVLDALK